MKIEDLVRRRIAWIIVLLLWAPGARAQDSLSSWPRQSDSAGWSVTMYQPQIESFAADQLEARAAVAVKGPEAKDPKFGAVWMSCRVSTDSDERTVTLIDMNVTGIKFPDLSEAQAGQLSAYLEAEMPTWHLQMDLDRLIAGLDEANVNTGGSDQLNHKPPKIYYRKSPTVLVFIDGKPMLKEVEGTSFQYVANTPYFLLFDTAAKTYYLKGGAFWYSSSKVDTGWQTLATVPQAVLDVAKKAEATADSTRPQVQPDSSVPEIKEPPAVIVSTEPAEILLSDGEPDFAAVDSTGLLYLKNSENDILMEIQTQQYYVLLAGRWYRSPSLENGPWKHVPPDQVPKDFAKIPTSSDMADVRPSVAGTQEAKDAVLEATIPQTAEVDRTKTLTVKYDGEPKFDPIEGTDMKYAVNTEKSVLLIKGKYYCCDDAVWYAAADPKGPWKVADSVPANVKDIPASSPVYNVKYVYVYDSTPEVVYVGYTPAYTGAYYYGGCMVYGTGYWYYPPYPAYYYPHPVTFGFGVHYNPWTGWGCTFGVSYGWLSIGFSTGGYYGGYWGAAGYHAGYRHGYAHGYYNGRRQGFAAGYRAGQNNPNGNRNMYRDKAGTRPTQPSNRPSAGTSDRQGNNKAGPSAGTSNRQGPQQGGNKAGAGTAAKPATRPTQAAGGANNVYTDKSGNVYKNEGGQWQKHDNSKGSWSPTGSATTQPSNRTSSTSNRATSTSGRASSSQQDLNRSAQSRNYGSQRAQSYQGSRGGGGRGGGGRGGGGRR